MIQVKVCAPACQKVIHRYNEFKKPCVLYGPGTRNRRCVRPALLGDQIQLQQIKAATPHTYCMVFTT